MRTIAGTFFDERANPRGLPKPLVGICGALVAVGLASFAFGLVSDPATAWRSYHVNFIYFAGLSQAALCVACALVIIGARWAGPVRHVAEGLAAWVPITLLLFLISFLGREHIYSAWIHGAPPGKETWLSIPRVYLADLLVVDGNPAENLRYLYPFGAIRKRDDDSMYRTQGIVYTIKDGVVVDNAKVMEEVARMVAESKATAGPDIVNSPFLPFPAWMSRPGGGGGSR